MDVLLMPVHESFDDAFDDIYGEAAPQVDTHDVLRAVYRRRLPALPQTAEHANRDETSWSFSPAAPRLVGAAQGEIIAKYPIFGMLHERFDRAIGRPKYIRVDGDEDYKAFRAQRRQPHIDALDARLAKLEAQFAQHQVDPHAHIVGAVADAARGGQAVPLPLPPQARARARGRIECWLDGDEVVVSVRLPTAVVTSGAPLQPDFEDVVGCAERCGFDGPDALLLGCHLAPSLTGERVLADMGQALPHLIGEGVYVAQPAAHAPTAAMMALLQRCQGGDRQACREAMAMAHDAPDLWERAADALQRAQHEKAGRT